MLCPKIVWEEIPYNEVSDITVNRQDLYELFRILDPEDEWQNFCAESIWIYNEDFMESKTKKHEKCRNPMLIMIDETLYPIFHHKYGCYNVYQPVWLRQYLPQEWLIRFPFIYPHTKYSLAWTIKSIIERHQGRMQFDDLCLEFMALYQWILSEEEKRDYRGTMISAIFLEQTCRSLSPTRSEIILKKENNKYNEVYLKQTEQQTPELITSHCENGPMDRILNSL